MAITDIASALAQYTASLPWQESEEKARNALDAVRFLLVNRLQHLGDSQTTMSYETLESEKKMLEKFLGIATDRAFGRSRRNRASFSSGGIG